MSDAGSGRPLRRGWTTGACATAATRAAFEALMTDAPPPDPVEIALPSGKRVAFALATFERERISPAPAWSRTPATIRTSPTAP